MEGRPYAVQHHTAGSLHHPRRCFCTGSWGQANVTIVDNTTSLSGQNWREQALAGDVHVGPHL